LVLTKDKVTQCFNETLHTKYAGDRQFN